MTDGEAIPDRLQVIQHARAADGPTAYQSVRSMRFCKGHPVLSEGNAGFWTSGGKSREGRRGALSRVPAVTIPGGKHLKDYATMTDEDLMDAYYRHDDHAFAQLDHRYRVRLAASAFTKLPRMAGRREKAEELAGKVLAQAADTRGRPSARWDRSKGCIGPWLITILHNVVVSHVRLKQGGDPLFSELTGTGDDAAKFEDTLTTDQPGPEDHLLAQARQQALRECVEELPPRERWVVTMQFWDALKNKEIAAILKVSEPTVSRTSDKGQRLLRDCLKRKNVL
jgi:RNA polymerase sigma factor (sigma-70 family)